jgi:hypothetical protein
MIGLLNEFKKFENGTICSSRTVRTVRDNTVHTYTYTYPLCKCLHIKPYYRHIPFM